jgi:iron-sulfur cluster insertion protein
MNEETLKVSDAAVSRIKQLITNKGQSGLKFRVHIQGGGCSGFQYGFQLDEQMLEDDIVLKHDGVDVLVDPLSMQYLQDAEVDFKNDLQGNRFFVNNPNAETTCGCGSSFSI